MESQPEKREELNYKIDCEKKMLTWIGMSWFNYYSFFICAYILANWKPQNDTGKQKRFKFVICVFFVFVPFMMIWNLYGNITIK